MKRHLLSIIGVFVFFSGTILQAQLTINYTTATTPVSCFGGNDGSATITSITGGVYYNTSTTGLLISEVYANPIGTDSCKEFVELVATRYIDFAATPYTVIFCNNGIAAASGWITGTNKTYAFSINSGTVNAGDVVYVGGAAMIPVTNRIRFINTASVGGDGGIGTGALAGVLGNGGANSDGVAVFNVAIGSITSSTVPIDAIMFGTGNGTAVVSGGSQGYEMPVNDYYPGGKLQPTSYFGPDATSGTLIKASFGLYNVFTNAWTIPRTWTTDSISNFTNLSSSLLIDRLYNVNWSNGCTSVYNPNLVAGNYTFTISDQIGTLTSGNVTVADGQYIDLNATASDPLACVGDTITLTAQNADVYIWDNGDTLSTTEIVVLADTLSIVFGTDTIIGCTGTDSVFIDVNDYPLVGFSMPNDTVCNDGGNVLLTGTPVGGIFTGSGVTGLTLDPSALSGINDITYTYTDGNGCSADSTVSYLILNCTGFETVSDLTANIYPNPAANYIWINSDKIDLKFTIMDMEGKTSYSGNLTTEKRIDVQGLVSGIYILHIFNNDISKKIKFIKN